MAKFIAHRGCVTGPEPSFENRVKFVEHALSLGHDVEIDIQSHNDVLYYGHDEPLAPVKLEFVTHPGVFCHAKDLTALGKLLAVPGIHTFWHETDTVTMTNQGYLWCFPGVHPRTERSIWLDLHNKPVPQDLNGIYAVCGDHAAVIKRK